MKKKKKSLMNQINMRLKNQNQTLKNLKSNRMKNLKRKNESLSAKIRLNCLLKTT